MKKRFNLATVAVLMVFVAVATYMTTYSRLRADINARMDYMSRIELSTEKFMSAKNTITNEFIGYCDEEMLNGGAVAGMIAALGDQWSYYMTEEQFAMRTGADKSFVGVGVTVSATDSSGYLRLLEVYSGYPADTAGLIPGDLIVAVDGEDVGTLGQGAALARMDGEEFTAVALTVRREGRQDFTVTLRRSVVVRPMVLSEIIDQNLGYIKVNGFETRVGGLFDEALRQIVTAGAGGLIIDMRDNPGGDVDEMRDMLSLLLPTCRLIILQSKNGVEEYKDSEGPAFTDMPVVVLINKDSYSAAEFFGACLREYDRAVLVGEPTTGKAYAQKDYRLQDGSGVHLSVMTYLTPGRVNLAQAGGLSPDKAVIFTDEQRERYRFDRSADTQLAAAVAHLRLSVPSPDGAELPPDSPEG
ncbi:MAG: PDZ domain-containing protein [Oscillospiraceae bacterium]|jgi:carboxyl-terminal processing protease|nr:PDZ domain-containing protein [Oscillospiraceae bacterium]